MGVLETYAFDFEPVYDDSGTDYLYTRVTLLVRAFVNGQAEVLDPLGGPFNGPGISYAFEDLVAPPPSARLKKTGGKIVGELQSGTTIGAGAIGQQSTDFGPRKKAIPVPPAPPAPKASPPPPDAARDLPPFQKTNVAFPSQPPSATNVGNAAGVERIPTSNLRNIVRVPNEAGLSHITVRHRLSSPRGRLYVFNGPGQESGKPKPGTDQRVEPPAQLILESPQRSDFNVDCKNGPKPKVLGIHTDLGDGNTLLVDWSVETYINEASLNQVSLVGALVSNRFAQTHAVDDDGYTTIATAGTAIFRTDFVYASPESPDFKRPILFQPIPQGFKRTIEYVTGRPDVTGVEYGYTDRQVSSNFVAAVYCKAANMSAVHRQAIVVGDSILSGALSVYERALNLLSQRNFAFPKEFVDSAGGGKGKRPARPRKMPVRLRGPIPKPMGR